CEGLSSPCLFGFFRPAIYVTPEAAQDKDMLRHVIVHEETHIRMHDQIHTLLCALYRIVYFFNPIVWLAVRCAEIDSELACDEETIKTLGERERIAYGETLLALAPLRRKRNPLLSAIPVSGGKKTMKQRISRIAVPGKTSIFALILAILLLASACTAVLGGEAADANAAEAGPFSPIFTNELMLSEADFLKSTGLSETDYTRADAGRTICLTLSRPVSIGTQAYTAEVHFNHGFPDEPMLQFDYLLDVQGVSEDVIYDALKSAAAQMTDFYGAPVTYDGGGNRVQDMQSSADFSRENAVREAWLIPGDWEIPGVTAENVICASYLRYDPDLDRIRLDFVIEHHPLSVYEQENGIAL
ncbi:MAG: M56 family metallopeptidase, partial [Oscillospiraceae bacterium]|nr:M56 family metallopeptidase [Oscillospiraceae bacterium]